MLSLQTPASEQNRVFLSRADIVVTCCGEGCSLRQASGDARPVRLTPAGEAVALLDGDRLFLNVSAHAHPRGHPLQGGDAPATASVRAGWLRQLVGVDLPGVARLYAVCDCAVEMELVRGEKLIDAGTRPPWYADAELPTKAPGSRFQQRLRALACLAEGLHGLHQRGLVHGDPFGTNAIVRPDGSAAWIDLNGVHPLSEELRALDVWGFVIYSLAAGCADTGAFSAEAAATALRPLGSSNLDDCLPQLANGLRAAADAGHAEVPFGDAASYAFADLLAGSGLGERSDALGAVHRRGCTRGLIVAFVAFQWNRQSALRWERHAEAERIRHRLVELELGRTIGARYQQQLDELRAWTSELESAKAWNSEQRVSWEKEATRLRELLEGEIERGKAAHAERVRAAAAQDAEIAWLRQQLDGRGTGREQPDAGERRSDLRSLVRRLSGRE